MDKIFRDNIRFNRIKHILELAEISKNKSNYLKEYEVPKSTYYKWRSAYLKHGDEGIRRKKPIAINHPKKIKPDIIAKVLELRKKFKLGTWRIVWCLERHHGVKISESRVTRIFQRHGVSKLTNSAKRFE